MNLEKNIMDGLFSPRLEHLLIQKEEIEEPYLVPLAALNYDVNGTLERFYIPPVVGEKKEISPPITKDEWLYISDSIDDLKSGAYTSSRPSQKIDDFLEELKR